MCLCVCVSLSVVCNSLQPMDCGLPVSFVHGILQARILEWAAISFSREWTWVSCTADRLFTVWATREASFYVYTSYFIIRKVSKIGIEVLGFNGICKFHCSIKDILNWNQCFSPPASAKKSTVITGTVWCCVVPLPQFLLRCQFCWPLLSQYQCKLNTVKKVNSIFLLVRKLSTEELILLNCGVGEDSWESLGLQGDPTSPFWRRSVLIILWKDWC